jgi:hypothetical protein
MIAGCGQTKVRQWNAAVTEPFRNRRAAKRGFSSTPGILSDALRAEGQVTPDISGDPSRTESENTPMMSGALVPVPDLGLDGAAYEEMPDADKRPLKRAAEDSDVDLDEEEVMREMINQEGSIPPISVQAPPGTKIAAPAPAPRKKPEEHDGDEGVMAALARLREAG